MLSKFITFEFYHKGLCGDPYNRKGMLVSDEDIAGTIRFFARNCFEKNKPMFWYRDNEITAV